MPNQSNGKLYNEGGELVAEGLCEVDEARGDVTMRPVYETHFIERQHGLLRLEMEDGAEYPVSDKVIRFRVNPPGAPGGAIYRLHLLPQRLDAMAEGAQ